MSVIIERLELTDEQVEYLRAHYPRTVVHQNCGSCLLYEALPQPTLRERAYKVVDPQWCDGRGVPLGGWSNDGTAIEDMARWLYENAGERKFSIGINADGEWYSSYLNCGGVLFSSPVDAYAHVVVGLGESS